LAASQSAGAAQETVRYQREDVERSGVVFVLQHVGNDTAYGVHVDVYGHMFPDSDDLTRAAVDAYLGILRTVCGLPGRWRS
jgi:hypothetical protein